ncbi:hypothetical protein GB931_15890 [Modestobacter sp. I12A-02628]|uniref:Uncharacterized protein n=1 Tax=Goekera deserti TaxID=2497753 RepID=A0A7K3WGN9_9ACTN|nr:hypothetical protein [Goekera deserti]MPQ99372.1 hypothetical protein [Goekera deserti]NDI50371.1 hypothetical protein [Goekera deserti]NEL55671.1 hypothetical protein [Goekera deserti]
MPLVFHWGGPRDQQVADLPADMLASAVLVYDGPRWLGVYERTDPVQVVRSDRGPAEVWVVKE